MNQIFRSRPAYLGFGLVLGLIIGLNIEGLWPSVPLHAAATHGIDKFAIATGLVDSSVEALYFLDFLTGDMRAAVINPKTGKFTSFFTRNMSPIRTSRAGFADCSLDSILPSSHARAASARVLKNLAAQSHLSILTRFINLLSVRSVRGTGIYFSISRR